MDGLTEVPTWTGVAPLLLWIKTLEILALVLLALALLTVMIGWMRHLYWWRHLSALVPLAASVGAASTVHALHDTYVFWSNVNNFCFGHGGCQPGMVKHAEDVAAHAAQTAALLSPLPNGLCAPIYSLPAYAPAYRINQDTSVTLGRPEALHVEPDH